MNRTSALAVASVALLFALGAGTAGGQDDLPPLPPLPKPDEKATFRLIVEGNGTAGQRVNGSGSNGACDISTSTSSGQRYEYGRGTGLEVVFTKYKFPGGPPLVLLKRKGQKQGVLFTVKGSYETSASGSATRSGDQNLCQPTTETVGDEEECGEKGPVRTNLFLNTSFGGDLVLGASVPSTGIPGFGCGANGVETVSGDPLYGWPNFPVLDPAPIPEGKIFGKGGKRSFKVDFEAPHVDEEAEYVVGSFVLRSFNTADHDAVARFIRERKKK